MRRGGFASRKGRDGQGKKTHRKPASAPSRGGGGPSERADGYAPMIESPAARPSAIQPKWRPLKYQPLATAAEPSTATALKTIQRRATSKSIEGAAMRRTPAQHHASAPLCQTARISGPTASARIEGLAKTRLSPSVAWTIALKIAAAPANSIAKFRIRALHTLLYGAFYLKRERNSRHFCMVAMAELLSAEKWVDFGLDVLSAQGFRALKADSLARALKVSRGSFYWHFADIDAFHRAIVDAWRRRSTERVIERLEAMPETAARLPELLASAFSTGGPLEKAVRAWALSANPIAVSAVAEVDAIRLRYIERLLSNANLPAEEVRARALVLYWAYVGRAMSADRGVDALAPVVSQLMRLAFGDGAKGAAAS